MLPVLIATGSAAGGLWLAFRFMPAQWTRDYYRPCAGGWAEALHVGCQGGPPRVLPQQPLNTWSNLAYIAVGVASGDPFFAVIMTVLGLSSALYHATSTIWAGRADVASMYLVLGYLVFSAFVPVWLALGLALPTAVILQRLVYRDLTLVIGFGFVAVLLARVRPETVERGAFGLGLFGLAYLVWELDRARKVPGHAGHAIWHTLTALGFGVLR